MQIHDQLNINATHKFVYTTLKTKNQRLRRSGRYQRPKF
jgi:hypothetical protein